MNKESPKVGAKTTPRFPSDATDQEIHFSIKSHIMKRSDELVLHKRKDHSINHLHYNNIVYVM